MITFTNPHGGQVTVPREDATLIEKVGNEETYTAKDPASGTTLVVTLQSEEVEDDPMGMEEGFEQQLIDGNINMVEDAEGTEFANPPKTLFNWKNLRLQSAISGERASGARPVGRAAERSLGRGARFLMRQIPANVSIRDSPFLLQITTAEMWFSYIQNMADSPIDMGAELSATVSPSQKIAVAMFVKEWEQDPGQRTLLSRITPGAEPSEARAIGNMIFDIITGRGPSIARAAGYGSLNSDKMFKLAYDMLISLPINIYNTYTLFQLEADEGGQVFSDVTRSYVPLEMTEIGLVLELRDKLAQLGPAYANTVIGEPTLAAEAAALMQKAVSAYNSGDTVTVRSILNYLQDSPFYYKSPTAGAKTVFDAESGDISGVNLGGKGGNKLKELAFNGLTYIKGFPKASIENSTGKIKTKSGEPTSWKNQSYEVVKSPFDATVEGVLAFGDKADKISFTPGAKLSKQRTGNQKKDEASRMEDILAGRDNPRKSPKGRGKFLMLQVHPKAQLDMKMSATAASGQGDLRHGKPPKGKDGSQNAWMKGLYNVLQKRIDEKNAKQGRGKSRKQKFPNMTVAVQGGKHKKTGKYAPYIIKLPKSHFKPKRLPSGETTIALNADSKDKELIKAWENFVAEYGVFIHKPSKGIHYRFIPSKKAEHRGAYYDKVRRQIGGAKRSR